MSSDSEDKGAGDELGMAVAAEVSLVGGQGLAAFLQTACSQVTLGMLISTRPSAEWVDCKSSREGVPLRVFRSLVTELGGRDRSVSGNS